MVFFKLKLVVVTTIMVTYTHLATIVAEDHVVGGQSGWTPREGATLYTTWAKGEKFHRADSLIFNFIGEHNVARVTKRAYDSCNTTQAMILGNKSPVKAPLSTGIFYFICTLHCGSGQKLTVEVK